MAMISVMGVWHSEEKAFIDLHSLLPPPLPVQFRAVQTQKFCKLGHARVAPVKVVPIYPRVTTLFDPYRKRAPKNEISTPRYAIFSVWSIGTVLHYRAWINLQILCYSYRCCCCCDIFWCVASARCLQHEELSRLFFSSDTSTVRFFCRGSKSNYSMI